jgi:hypothetical protein
MIERRSTNVPPPPYRGRIAAAFDHAQSLIVEDPTVRSLVKGHERVAGPIELAACLGRPRALPWLYLAVQSGTVTLLGSGRGGVPQYGGPVEVAAAVVVPGGDPDHGLRVWDAIREAVARDYRNPARLRRMWDAGVSGVVAGPHPTSLASGPEMTEKRSAVLGSILITI